MLVAAASLAFLLQLPDTVPPRIYDSPQTEALVAHAIAGSAQIPPDLQDYLADVQTSMFITLATDSVGGDDLPASVDETVSQVRWSRNGFVEQVVRGHRTRLLVPLPYTLATVMERPWIIPHLYGEDIYTPFVGRRAVNPFGRRGPRFYSYAALDTVRLMTQSGTVSLVPLVVRPLAEPETKDELLVLGTFYVDVERGAVARARFAFMGEGRGALPRTISEVGSYLEVDNGLWEGRYWLPYTQRRDIIIESRLMGGALAARVVSRWLGYELNRGWEPSGPRTRLSWELDESGDPFEGWRADLGEDAARYSMDDFADLRLATAVAAQGEGSGPRVQLYYQRGSHLFRFNRVEGPFLGLGARVVPSDPQARPGQLYATAGWAFAEATPRGEVGLLRGEPVTRTRTEGTKLGVGLTAYRRLVDIQPFRATYNWDWIYTFPALLFGHDERDYYDAIGAELFGTMRRGRWDARLGVRAERQDSVSVNTRRFLFGIADEFDPLAGIEPGNQVAFEGATGYALGPGAFGMGNSLVLRGSGEVGVADFDYGRVWGLLSARYQKGVFTAAARVDAGYAQGGVPPQRLFRFGSVEGLRGYEPDEFGGNSALLARGRFLVGLPPRSLEPLARVDVFLIPPLRPALVLVGETGWTGISPDLEDELAILGSTTTDGFRSSVGVGLSFFEDAVTVERLHPVGPGSGELDGRWYVGLTYWY